jgi:uncharacterized protein (TIGR03083 family)
MTEPMLERLAEVWSDVAVLTDGLSEAQWALPTDCPGWTVKDNVAHMIGTERMLLGETAPAGASGDAPYVRNDIGRANEQWIDTYRSRPGAEVRTAFLEVTGRRLDALRALSADAWEREGFTPEGPGPYRKFMEIRVFDCWFHDQDIREALGRPGFLEGPVADLSIGRIPSGGLGFVVGKKAAAPPGTTVVFVVEGAAPITATIEVPPEGRARLLSGAPLADPTVRIISDRRTFSRLAGGRWSEDRARETGRVLIEGDETLGGRIVAAMGYTI